MDDSVEVVCLCPGKEKRKAYTYETIDVFQQGKGKRDRITFARKGNKGKTSIGPYTKQNL